MGCFGGPLKFLRFLASKPDLFLAGNPDAGGSKFPSGRCGIRINPCCLKPTVSGSRRAVNDSLAGPNATGGFEGLVKALPKSAMSQFGEGIGEATGIKYQIPA